jgi:hypothetical protein
MGRGARRRRSTHGRRICRTDEDAAEWEGAYLLGEEPARPSHSGRYVAAISVARWAERYGSEGVADGDEHAKFARSTIFCSKRSASRQPRRASRTRCVARKFLRVCGFTSKRLQVHGVRAVWWGKNATPCHTCFQRYGGSKNQHINSYLGVPYLPYLFLYLYRESEEGSHRCYTRARTARKEGFTPKKVWQVWHELAPHPVERVMRKPH